MLPAIESMTTLTDHFDLASVDIVDRFFVAEDHTIHNVLIESSHHTGEPVTCINMMSEQERPFDRCVERQAVRLYEVPDREHGGRYFETALDVDQLRERLIGGELDDFLLLQVRDGRRAVDSRRSMELLGATASIDLFDCRFADTILIADLVVSHSFRDIMHDIRQILRADSRSLSNDPLRLKVSRADRAVSMLFEDLRLVRLMNPLVLGLAQQRVPVEDEPASSVMVVAGISSESSFRTL